jgi:hypothetical protein
VGEAKQIEAEREGYGTYQDCGWNDLANPEMCTAESPCEECLWADRQDAERQQ